MSAVEVLDEIRARADAATPGPWFVHEKGRVFVGTGRPESLRDVIHASGDAMDDLKPEAAVRARANSEFIAAARSVVPALEAALRAVLDRHPKCVVQTGSQTHGGPPQYGDVCGGCRELWPCGDVRAIESALTERTKA